MRPGQTRNNHREEDCSSSLTLFTYQTETRTSAIFCEHRKRVLNERDANQGHQVRARGRLTCDLKTASMLTGDQKVLFRPVTPRAPEHLSSRKSEDTCGQGVGSARRGVTARAGEHTASLCVSECAKTAGCCTESHTLARALKRALTRALPGS